MKRLLRNSGPWKPVGQLLLWIAAVPLALGSWFLHSRMPTNRLRAKLSGDSTKIYWEHLNDEDFVRTLDLDTGELSTAPAADVAARPAISTQTQLLREDGTRYSIASFPSREEPDGYRRIELPYDGQRLEVLKEGEELNKFAVGASADGVLAYDLEQPSEAPQSIQASVELGPWSIFGSEGAFLVHTAEASSKTGPGTGPQSTFDSEAVEIYRMVDSKLQRIARISTGVVGLFDGQLITISEDGQRVEFRNLHDFRVDSSVQLPPEFLGKYVVGGISWVWVRGINSTTGECAHFDLETHEVVMVQGWCRLMLHNHRFMILDGPSPTGLENEWFVYDRKVGRVVFTEPYRPIVFQATGDQTLVATYPSMGVVAKVYDLGTGAIRRYAPFQWCAVLLALLLMGWCIWLSALVVSAPVPQLLTFGGLAICGFVGAVVCGEILLFNRYFFRGLICSHVGAVFFGCAIGLITATSCWAGLRNTAFRLAWPLAIFSLVAGVQACEVLRESGRTRFEYASVVLIFVVAALIAVACGFVLRWAGWCVGAA
ncbi:MAG TPA: hypothetical protein DDW52_04510, partial [Planctomycetaceae bacterium]|nr:hypothetical protein [Planctomycetaceae bacterium]